MYKRTIQSILEGKWKSILSAKCELSHLYEIIVKKSSPCHLCSSFLFYNIKEQNHEPVPSDVFLYTFGTQRRPFGIGVEFGNGASK